MVSRDLHCQIMSFSIAASSGHYFTLLLKVPVRYCLVTFYSFTKRRRMEFRSTIIEDISIVSRDSYLYWTLCVVTSVLIVSGHIMEAHDEQRSYSWINTVCSAVLFWLIFVHRERWVSCFLMRFYLCYRVTLGWVHRSRTVSFWCLPD